VPVDTDLEIRDATPEDAERIALLLGELGYPTESHDTRERLVRLLGSPSDRSIVAELQGEVVGLGCVHRMYGLHDEQAIALIMALVVGERARGGGVGRKVLGALEDVARAWGCERILVTSANRRVEAHAFYERGGYAFTGRRFARSL
jgi:GNAT superfamily N-acetyltransferase